MLDAMYEIITTYSIPSILVIIATTFLILLALPTEVPPNFKTNISLNFKQKNNEKTSSTILFNIFTYYNTVFKFKQQ